jgi:hypothetical protein
VLEYAFGMAGDAQVSMGTVDELIRFPKHHMLEVRMRFEEFPLVLSALTASPTSTTW